MIAKLLAVGLWILALTASASAQVDAGDPAQDAAPAAITAPAAPCGTQPIAIARMSWPSAELLAEVHARILAREFGCEVRVTPGDLVATASSMGSTGQPAVAPEMWVTRIADVWNAAIAAQMLRPATPTYIESSFEGWFLPNYIAASHPELTGADTLASAIPGLGATAPVRFISCPADWACAVINRNLLAAFGLTDLVELVEPANRFEMDMLIAEAVSRSEPFFFYYWQPNAVLHQFNFQPLALGDFSPEAAKCLASVVCPAPQPSAYPNDTVVVALAEWVFTDIAEIAGYFGRSSLPSAEMNQMLAQLGETGATVEAVADLFVAERQDVWRAWVGTAP